MSRSAVSATVATAAGTPATRAPAPPRQAGGRRRAAARRRGCRGDAVDAATGALAAPLRGRRQKRAVRGQDEKRQDDSKENALFHERIKFRRGGTGSKPDEPSGWQRASRRMPSQTPSSDAVGANGVGHVGRAGRMKPARAGEERRDQQLVGAQRAKREPLRQAELTAIALAHRAVPRSRHTPTRGWLNDASNTARRGTTTMS